MTFKPTLTSEPKESPASKPCTWGLDLSGQNGDNLGGIGVPPVGLHGAGGIGGLLAMVDVANTRQMAYFYNANGDVGQLVDSDAGAGTFGNTLAKYEYYPYGGIFFSLGGFGYTPPNPFKFSTKYRDDESALYYYGYRYHMPRLGRWTSRDPIGISGGVNVLCAFRNSPINMVDLHGLDCGPWKSLGVTLEFRHKVVKEEICGQGYKDKEEYDLDFEIFFAHNVVIHIIGKNLEGKGDDAELEFGAFYRFHDPRLQDIFKSGVDEEGKWLGSRTGIACRKYEQCVRKCQRCCYGPSKCTGGAGFVPMSEHQEQTRIVGKGQWVYGQLKGDSPSGFYHCDLFPYGARVSVSGYGIIQNPAGPLNCDDASVPKCDGDGAKK